MANILTADEAAEAFSHSQTCKTLQKTRFRQKMQAISQTFIMKNKSQKRWRKQKRKKGLFMKKTTVCNITGYVPVTLKMFSALITLNKEAFK